VPPDLWQAISTIEMHPRNHQAMVQKPKLHVLPTKRRADIILLAMGLRISSSIGGWISN
jgi:hypothetical protein